MRMMYDVTQTETDSRLCYKAQALQQWMDGGEEESSDKQPRLSHNSAPEMSPQ